MIKKIYSRRHKQFVYRLDATLNGKRFRRFFLKKSEAEAVAYKTKHETAKRYGIPIMQERPMRLDLIDKRLETIANHNEKTRSQRVLKDLLALQVPGVCVDEISKASIQKYLEKRQRDGLKAQSIDRELNIIAAMFNSVDLYYPQLEQWRPPRIPRPKIIGGRRERIWTDAEREAILTVLCAPRQKGEQLHSRYRIGLKVQFCLLNGVRHSEMNLIKPRDID